jgi:hypothetical protein
VPGTKSGGASILAHFRFDSEEPFGRSGKYEKQVFDALMAKSDLEAAAGVAN